MAVADGMDNVGVGRPGVLKRLEILISQSSTTTKEPHRKSKVRSKVIQILKDNRDEYALKNSLHCVSAGNKDIWSTHLTNVLLSKGLQRLTISLAM